MNTERPWPVKQNDTDTSFSTDLLQGNILQDDNNLDFAPPPLILLTVVFYALLAHFM